MLRRLFHAIFFPIGVITILLMTESLIAQTAPFFREGFETNLTGSFNSDNFGTLAGQPEFSRQSSVAVVGTWALAHAISSGSEPGFATQHFGDGGAFLGSPILSGTAGTHYNDLYVQWHIRYSSGFNFNVHFKQFIIGTEDNHEHILPGIGSPNPWAADYLTIYTAASTRQLRAEYNRKNTTGGGEFFDLFPNLGQSDTLSTNTWYTVEVRRKLDTPGVGTSDGIFQMWLNGVLIASYSNVDWRIPWDGDFGTEETYKNNFLLLSDYANLPGSSGTVYYDDIQMATGPIGTGVVASTPNRVRIRQR